MVLADYYTIALDVGQTFIRSAVLDDQGRILPDSFSIFSTKSTESKETMLENFVKIIKFNINSILHPHFKIKWIGFSFSGVFISDQEEDNLLKDKLEEALMKVPSIKGKLTQNCQFHFEKDAHLFAIGENILRLKENQRKKILYLIIGSSLSSAQMVDGQLVTEASEKVETQLMGERVIGDYISSRGLMAIAKNMSINLEGIGPKELEKLALKGDSKAIKVFETFGEYLGQALKETIIKFSPDEIILGGNLALSYTLFKQNFERAVNHNKIIISATEHTSYYIFFGISERIKKLTFEE